MPTDSPLRGPESLVGKRINISSYQTTVSVLAKGDLDHEYGVPWKSITWVTNREELLPFETPHDVHIERAPDGATSADVLMSGSVDAALFPRPPLSLIAQGNRVRRLFDDGRAAEEAYARNRGYWPIMHVLAVREQVANEHPWVPRALYDAFERSQKHARDYYLDPNWSVLAWTQYYAEQERGVMGDPWTNGLTRNRRNLEEFVTYSFEQGLISQALPVERLFHESLLDT